VKKKNPKIRTILWMHMMGDQPALVHTAQAWSSVDLVVYVSEAQKQNIEMYYGAPVRSVVIGNAIAPCFEGLFSSVDEILASKECRGIYTPTPFRGLTYLLDTADKINIDIDVFSSMRTYQTADSDYKDILERAKSHRNVKYMGAVGQKDLITPLKKAAFFAYPCIFAETFCLSALESMAAGVKVVSTRLGAMESTCAGYGDLVGVDYTDSRNFVKGFSDQLKWNVAQFRAKPKEWADKMLEQVMMVNEKCTWKARMKEWEQVWN
jgi:hypothetical protein